MAEGCPPGQIYVKPYTRRGAPWMKKQEIHVKGYCRRLPPWAKKR